MGNDCGSGLKLVIGLTGGMATGKSTVAKMLADLGAEVIDLDEVARDLIRPNTPEWQEVVSRFGKDILNPDETINRKKLASVVFADESALKDLNKIVHPSIIQFVRNRIDKFRKDSGKSVLVVDAPLLIEAGMLHLVDVVWVVTTDEETQIRRAMARSDLTRAETLARMQSQLPLSEKVKLADAVIDNSGPLDVTRGQVEKLWKGLSMYWKRQDCRRDTLRGQS